MHMKSMILKIIENNYYSFVLLFIIDVHLAVLIDNNDHVVDKNDSIELTETAERIKTHLEEIKFHILSFNNLSSQSIADLLQIITTRIDSSQLAVFALIILLGKRKKHSEIDLIQILSVLSTSSIAQVPKLIITAAADVAKIPPITPEMYPSKSIVVTISLYNTESQVVIDTFKDKLQNCFIKPIKESFNEMCDDIAMIKGTTCHYVVTFDDSEILPTPYEPVDQRY